MKIKKSDFYATPTTCIFLGYAKGIRTVLRNAQTFGNCPPALLKTTVNNMRFWSECAFKEVKRLSAKNAVNQ